jgi:hypothetical protein
VSFICNCGNRIATNQAPSKTHGSFVTEADLDDSVSQGHLGLDQMVDTPEESQLEQLNASVLDAYYAVARFVVFCNVCARLHIQVEPASEEYASYRLEPESFGPSEA